MKYNYKKRVQQFDLEGFFIVILIMLDLVVLWVLLYRPDVLVAGFNG